MKVLVAGLGAMGLPMARALVAAGFDVDGYDRAVRPPDFTPLAHPDLADADTLVIVVRDAVEIEALCFDEESIFACPPHPARVLLCSTVSVDAVHALRARLPAGVALVDAPMSGAPVAAAERRLSFMLGGDAADIDAVLPLVRAMGRTHHHLGPLGAGMTVKVLNNSVAAASVVAVRRVLDQAALLDVEPATLLGVMRESSGATWFGDAFERISWAGEGHAADNTMGILVKDVLAGIRSTGRAPDAWDDALLGELRAMTPYAPGTSGAPGAPPDARPGPPRPPRPPGPDDTDRSDRTTRPV